MSVLTGRTTAKKTTAATATKVMMSLINMPYWKTPPPIWKLSPSKPVPLVPGMARICRMNLTTSLITMPRNVAMMTATARSMTLPCTTKSLNSR